MLDVIGVVATVGIRVRRPKRALVRSPGSARTTRAVLLWWLALFASAGLWVFLLGPIAGQQVGVFLVTVVMFGYVTIGLWSGRRFMIWLGPAVTIISVGGYTLLPAYFSLLMALAGGGALLGTGLYIHMRWR